MDSAVLKQQTANLQQRASNPKYSVFVSASAGSGKTKILTDRVLRLLLLGTDPSKILCLTFTKAAAAEMQSRIYKELNSWICLTAKELYKKIFDLFGTQIPQDYQATAQSLFARTLDANPTLKISTIHSFCEGLIRKFPVEIKVNPNFQIIDSQQENKLLEKAKKELLKTALTNQNLANKIAEITGHLNENSFLEIILELINKRDKLAVLKQQHININGVIEKIYQILGCKIPDNQTTVEKLIGKPDFDKNNLLLLCAEMELSCRETDKKNGAAISNYLQNPSKDSFDKYQSVFLTVKQEARKVIATSGILNSFEQAEAIIDQEQCRVISLVDHINSIAVANSTANLLFVADKMLEIYIKHKNKNSLLDYSDLIAKASHLLQDSDNAQWIRYKLDSNIEHILIDEAQDTNHYQWSIIDALAEEFFSGQAAIDKNRTIFIVGDEKQSIYSFQGADPNIFNDKRNYYQQKLSLINSPVQDIRLNNSWRSLSAILKAVDLVFSQPQYGHAISKLKKISHNAIRQDYFGTVQLWPIIDVASKKDSQPEEYAWSLDFEIQNQYKSKELLAQIIAKTIKGWIDNKRILKSAKRPIKYSDIMILLKNRTNNLGNLLIKHLQNEQIPVTGRDKIDLTKHIIVQDLLAAAKFILLPIDDLNLACLLKSPLIALDEEQLMDLCLVKNKQKISLFAALKNGQKYQEICQYLADITAANNQKQYQLYDLFSYILAAKEGKKAIINRFGKEAEEIINQFLMLCLNYQQNNIVNLEKFIDSLNNAHQEVKININNQELNEVRITTIHSAKGLEAPIVFLADSAHSQNSKYGGNNSQKIIWANQKYGNLPLWPCGKNNQLLKEIKISAREDKNNEYLRQLYVAMTRAEDELYITGFGTGFGSKMAGDCWYNIIKESFTQDGVDAENITAKKFNFSQLLKEKDQNYLADCLINEGIVIDKEEKSPPTSQIDNLVLEKTMIKTLPSFIKEPITQLPQADIIYPSKLTEEQNNSVFEFNQKLNQGKIIHKILEILPDIHSINPLGNPLEKKSLIDQYLQKNYCLDKKQCHIILKQIFNILDNKKFSYLFTKNSKSEVPIIGKINGKLISGRIDRLVINEKEVIIIDYKTGQKNNDYNNGISSQYKNQLLIYKNILQKIYPKKKIKCAVIFTDSAEILDL